MHVWQWLITGLVIGIAAGALGLVALLRGGGRLVAAGRGAGAPGATHDLPAESLIGRLGRLSASEYAALAKFLQRHPVSRESSREPGDSLGGRVADRVALFGGSWAFLGLFATVMLGWTIYNVEAARPFDPFPFILLNLMLSCLAAIQAPIILMSQNRAAFHDRMQARADYEVNLKAELEILALHEKIDELRQRSWQDLVAQQQRQIELLEELARRPAKD
jgi:uncharacterized membrane protein